MERLIKRFSLLGVLFCMGHANALVPKSGNEPTYCEQIVSLHGFLSRAQFECGYSKYNEELITDSAKCFKHELGDEYGKKVLTFGMEEFDRNVQDKGKPQICRDLLKEFSEYVQK
ncbi:hypothetical protein [Acinetobacter sp. P1(2025)]|uniref:hypothetical protein n=1 Tax=Acinetobacter sp. P1(2025) TaxID=3446120 RepID=UPI003F52A420